MNTNLNAIAVKVQGNYSNAEINKAKSFLNRENVYKQFKTMVSFLIPNRKNVKLYLNVGGGSYTDGKQVTVGLPELFIRKSEAEMFSALRALLGHETQHINSSDFEAFVKFQKDIGEYFYKKYKIPTHYGQKVAKYLFNSVEDGRIEKILCNRLPGYKKHIQFLNGTFWELQEIGGKSELEDFLYTITSYSVTGLYPKGFKDHYKGTALHDNMKKIQDDIHRGIDAVTCKDCVWVCHDIILKAEDYLVELLKNRSAEDEEFMNNIPEQNEWTTSEETDKNTGEGSSHLVPRKQKKKEKQKEEEQESQDGEGSDSDEEQNKEEDKDQKGKGKSKKQDKEDEENQDEASGSGEGDEEDLKESDESEENGEKGSSDQSEEESEEDESGDGSDKDSDEESEEGEEDNSNQDSDENSDSDSNEDSDEGEEGNSDQDSDDDSENDSDSDSDESSDQNESSDNSDNQSDSDDKSTEATDDIPDESDDYPPGTNQADEDDDELDIDEDMIREHMKEITDEIIEEAERKLEEDKPKKEPKSSKDKKEEGLTPEDYKSIEDKYKNQSVKKFKEIKGFTNYHALPLEIRREGAKFRKEVEKIFRNKESFNLRAQKRGIVDTSNLYKVAVNDYNVFMKKGTPVTTDFVAFILQDGSGSMTEYGKEFQSAKAMSVIEEGLKGIIPFKLSTFSVEFYANNVIHYTAKDWKDNDKSHNYAYNFHRNRRANGGNKDGYSIRVATTELMKRPEKDRILIILSDGLPSDYDRGYKQGMDDVKQAVKEARQKGIHVVSLIFGTESFRDMNIDNYKYMYDKNIISCKPELITSNLIKMLKKVISR